MFDVDFTRASPSATAEFPGLNGMLPQAPRQHSSVNAMIPTRRSGEGGHGHDTPGPTCPDYTGQDGDERYGLLNGEIARATSLSGAWHTVSLVLAGR